MSEGETYISSFGKSTKVCSSVIMCVMPTLQIVVGVVYKNDCPLQPYIPIYLMVTGVITLLLSMLAILALDPSFGNIWKYLSALMSVFFLCWFIAGNVWIYSIYEPNYDKTSVNPYCDKTLYLFSFWTTTLTYILSGLLFLFGCCAACCLSCGD